jgi:hypothetical protein
VDVHVHAARVRGDLDGHGGIAAGGDSRPVSVVEAAVEVVGPHEAAVHRDCLVGPATLGQAREGGVAGDLERARLVLDLAQCAGFCNAQDLGESL